MKLAVPQKRRRARPGKRASRALGRRGGPQATNAGLSASRPSGDPQAAQAAPGGQHGAGRAHVRRYDHLRLSQRVLLIPGDRIRVSAGPYFESHDDDGNVVATKMAERGVMTFEEYCELGESRWILARGKAGYAALHIGVQERSELLPGLVRRPYKVRKVRRSRKPRPGSDSL